MLRRPATTLSLSRDDVEDLIMELSETLKHKDRLKGWNEKNSNIASSTLNNDVNTALDTIEMMEDSEIGTNMKENEGTRDLVEDEVMEPVDSSNYSNSFKFADTTLNSELESDARPTNIQQQQTGNPFYSNMK